MSQPKPKQTKQIITFFWRAICEYPWSIVAVLIFVPAAVLANGVLPPLVLARVLDRLSSGDFLASQPLQSFQLEILIYALLIFSSSLVFWRIVDRTIFRLEGNVQRDLAQMVFRHIMNQSADFHANNFSGSLVSQTNKLTGSYIRIADTTAFGVLPLITTIIASVLFLFQDAPLFVIALIVFCFIYIPVSFRVSRGVRVAVSRHAAQESKQTGALADAITNAMAIKSFATDEFENEKFAKITDKTRVHLLTFMKAHQRQMIFFTTMTNTIMAGSLVLAIISVVTFEAEVATAFLIFNYSANIVTQLFQFSNQHLRSYNRAFGDAAEMVAILNTPPEIRDSSDPEKVAIVRGAIEFEGVRFTHKDADESIFKNLSLRIKPGEKVGLVGHSGSGKSTLIRLLLRFSDIQSGSIKIDAQNIAHITQNDLRSSIAYVPQEPLLFHRTIGENISYSRPDAVIEEIRGVARKANAAEFVEKLPLGYDTIVGERGIKLSGGQRQRIAIARAMLKNAPILVLDEATSALDSESEALIQDALWNLMEGRTAIVIAHRLSTIQRMDRIIVLDNGQIKEQGTHKELIAQNGTYAKLWQRQSGGFLED